MGFIKASLVNGSSIEFSEDLLGRGAEKVVFLSRDKQSVVCFFHTSLADHQERRARLDRIVGNFNPTTGQPHGDFWKKHFCWPTGIIDSVKLPPAFVSANQIVTPCLGLVGPVFRSNFYFVNKRGVKVEKDGKWFTREKPRQMVPPDERGNLLGYLQACTRIARAVRKMHLTGLAHSDLSNRNVLIDPKGGDALIVEVDGLVVPNVAPPSVFGTPGYIAPEVISGKALPSILTDLHALPVLIYEALLIRHPLSGPKVRSVKSADEDEMLAMGPQALFIEHPSDNSNHLKPPPTKVTGTFGPYLADLFTRAFVAGLHSPAGRPQAAQWEGALYRTFDWLHPSPGGSGEWFILGPGMPFKCPQTGQSHAQPVPFARYYTEAKPGNFVHEKHGLTIWDGLQLMRWHAQSAYAPDENADRTPLGYFRFHQGRWWLVNQSGSAMKTPQGRSVPHGEAVEITPGLQLRVSSDPKGRLFLFELLTP